MLAYCLPASIVFDKEFIVILMFVSFIENVSLFSEKFAFLSLILSNLITVGLSIVSLCFLAPRILWFSWICEFIVFLKFGKIFLFFLQILFLIPTIHFSEPPTECEVILQLIDFSAYLKVLSFLCMLHFG